MINTTPFVMFYSITSNKAKYKVCLNSVSLQKYAHMTLCLLWLCKWTSGSLCLLNSEEGVSLSLDHSDAGARLPWSQARCGGERHQGVCTTGQLLHRHRREEHGVKMKWLHRALFTTFSFPLHTSFVLGFLALQQCVRLTVTVAFKVEGSTVSVLKKVCCDWLALMNLNALFLHFFFLTVLEFHF